MSDSSNTVSRVEDGARIAAPHASSPPTAAAATTSVPTPSGRGLGARLKAAAVRIATGSGAANLCRPFTRHAAVTFMLHRFSDPDRGVSGQDLASLRELLGYLRREKYRLVDLATLFSSLRGERAPLQHAVAFTIDDGYLDHATVAGPAFAEFDCPVTTFVTSGFLDGLIWFWWDQIEYVFVHTRRPSLTVDLGDSVTRYELKDAASRRAAQDDFTTRCKSLREPEKLDAIRHLAATAEVALPRAAPPMYAPMSWGQLRSCERAGMTFGPHTVTHPILARTSDAQARAEISQSWTRLRSEASGAVPLFAYPNGQTGDFGDRELEIMRDVGIQGAVVGTAGFCTSKRFHRANGEFMVPRFPFPEGLPHLIQQVSGLERLKFLMRGDE